MKIISSKPSASAKRLPARVVSEYLLMDGASPVTQLLVEWSHGNQAALGELTPHVYRELHALAKSYLRRGRPHQKLQPTATINEACIRLLGQSQPVEWENRAHFFGIAARLMRMVLVDYSRAHKATKRGGGAGPVTLDDAMALSPSRAPDVLEVNEALDHLANVDERKPKVIELRHFGGMDREGISSD